MTNQSIADMKKGLDRAFLEYGIRQPDLQVIAELCEKHELDSEWLKEQVLKRYHEAKVDRIEMDDAISASRTRSWPMISRPDGSQELR